MTTPDPLVVALEEALDVVSHGTLMSLYVRLSFDLDDNEAHNPPEWGVRRRALLELLEPRVRRLYGPAAGEVVS